MKARLGLIILFIGLIGVTTPTLPMKPSKPLPTYSFAKNGSWPVFKWNLPRVIIKDIDAVEKDGYIAIDNQFLTNDAIIESLKNALARGVTVDINLALNYKNQNAAKPLIDAGATVRFIKNLHCKRFIISNVNPATRHPKKDYENAAVHEGSYNASKIANFHHEVMIRTQGDPDFITQHLQDHKFISSNPQNPKQEQKQILTSIPKKKFMIDTLKWNQTASLIAILDQTKPGDIVNIASMTFNDFKLIDTLIKKYKQGIKIKIVVDESALQSKPFYWKIFKAGIPTYVWNYNRNIKTPQFDNPIYTQGLQDLSVEELEKMGINYWKIQQEEEKNPQRLMHIKLITIMEKNKSSCLVISSSANFTWGSQLQINTISFYPNDFYLYNSIQSNFFDKVKAMYVSLKRIVEMQRKAEKSGQEKPFGRYKPY